MLSFGTLGVYRDSAAGSGYAVGMLLMVIFAWLGGSVAGTSILGGVDAAGIAIVQNGLGGKQWHHGSVLGWGMVEDPYRKTGAAAALMLGFFEQRVGEDNGTGKNFSYDGSGQEVLLKMPSKLSDQAQFLFQVQGSNLSVMHTFVDSMVSQDGGFEGQAQGCTSFPRALQAFSMCFLTVVQSFLYLSKAGEVAECDVSGAAALLKLGFWMSGAMLQTAAVNVQALSNVVANGMRIVLEFDIRHFMVIRSLDVRPKISFRLLSVVMSCSRVASGTIVFSFLQGTEQGL